MKNNETIKLLRSYREEGCEQSFNLVYESFKNIISKIANEKTIGTDFPKTEMISALNKDFWKLSLKFNENKSENFGSFIKATLRKRAIDLIKCSNGTYYRRVKSILDESREEEDDDENAPTFEVIDESENVEQKVMEADQRQLIDFLLSKANARTTAIVKAFLDGEPITAIAKSLGINHHETVHREIRKLAKNHEPSQFGDYHDFLAS
jgi:RNA polymerase sigma factor (sigma-70 family)